MEHCQPCKDSGRLIVAHYKSASGSPAMCWDHKHGMDTRPAAAPGEKPTRVIENTKNGPVEQGKCLTPGCTNTRHALDCTGYCRSCKQANGIPVAPSRREKPAPVRHIEPATVAVSNLPEAFLLSVLNLLPHEVQIQAVRAVWVKLPRQLQEEIAARAMDLHTKSPANEAKTNGDGC